MTEQSSIEATSDPCYLTVGALRAELALTLAEMGDRIGLSKSQMHEVERSGRASLRVALAIEALSGQRIDAAVLSDDVRAARHAASTTADGRAASNGQAAEMSGRGEGRTHGPASAIDDDLPEAAE